jgi:hypothetical protein
MNYIPITLVVVLMSLQAPGSALAHHCDHRDADREKYGGHQFERGWKRPAPMRHPFNHMKHRPNLDQDDAGHMNDVVE